MSLQHQICKASHAWASDMPIVSAEKLWTECICTIVTICFEQAMPSSENLDLRRL